MPHRSGRYRSRSDSFLPTTARGPNRCAAALRVAGPAEMRHLPEPRIERQSILETRSALPEEVLLAVKIQISALWDQPVSRDRRHRGIGIAVRMRKLLPIQFATYQGFDIRRFVFAQTLGASIHPDSALGQALPGLRSAGPDDLIGFDLPIIG